LGFILQAWAFAGLDWPGLRARGLDSLAQKPGPHGLGFLGYVVKTRD
jgi:hypothetical protein